MEEYRAPTLYQPSDLVKALGAAQQGEFRGSRHMFGAALSIAHTDSAKCMAVLGLDFVFIDAQHTYVVFTLGSTTCAI